MTTYSILPNVPLDPRSESNLVIAAAQRVYEASNGRLNNFSSNSPTLALLEGQAYAGSELLYYLNQLPEAIILEWLSGLLGIQRRLGTPSKSTLEVNIAPHGDPWVLRAGFIVRSNTSITGDEEVLFSTDTDLVIPQESQGFVNVTSIDVGSSQNLDSNIITEFEDNLAFLRSVRNTSPATGGTDEEDLLSVKQRAFSYIRRRNPVSESDWIEYITNLLGVGSIVLVRNRRPEIERQVSDALYNANHVTFFVLGPEASVLSNAQLAAVQSKVKSHLPVNVQGHVYNINTQNVDMVARVSYNAAKRGGTLKEFSEQIYNSLSEYLRPNNYFDMGEPIQIYDLITLFAQDYAYVSPNIESLTCFSAPENLSALSSQWKEWKTGQIYLLDELIESNGLFYQVIQNFDPVGTDPIDRVNDGILQFNRVKDWVDFPHRLNDVVVESGNYYLVLDNVSGTDPVIGNNVTSGKVSNIKTPLDWVSGADLNANDLVWSKDENGDNILDEMYVVKEDVTVVNTGTIADSEIAGFISSVNPVRLEQGSSYTTGDYVFIANQFAGFDYYKVLNDFTFDNLSSTLQETFKGNITQVIVHTTTPSTFRGRKYKARFRTREFLRLEDNNIYQVGFDFTPDDSTIVEMITDRRLYQTQYTTDPDFGGINTFTTSKSGYSVELKDVTISLPNLDEFVTDGDGESLILQFDLDRGRFDINGVNIVSPGGDYLVGDIITIPTRLTEYIELDRPIYLEVDSIDGNGGVTGLIETEFQSSSITFLRKWNIVLDLASYGVNSTGVNGQLRGDVIFNDPYSYRGDLVNFTIENPGDGYDAQELLYIDFSTGFLDTNLASIESEDAQLTIDSIVSNLPFNYRDFNKVLEGDIINIGENYYTANRSFTPVIEGESFYTQEGIISPLYSPTQNQKDNSIDLFGSVLTNNIPTPLITLPGLVTYDNKASVYSTTTNAFDGDNGTFWASREVGSDVADTSYIGLDLGFDAFITGISFTNTTSVNPLEPTTASFDVQYSTRGINGPWVTVGTGTNSEAVQSFTDINIEARFWRFIANGSQVPYATRNWRISNIEFTGDISNIIERREDIILYDDNNTTAFYRVMRTFTPDLDTEPRGHELDDKLLKIVSRYDNGEYIKPRTDFSGLDPGWFRIDFHPHGSPEQITRYVIENKLGSNLVYSIEPSNPNGNIVDYKDGTFAL